MTDGQLTLARVGPWASQTICPRRPGGVADVESPRGPEGVADVSPRRPVGVADVESPRRPEGVADVSPRRPEGVAVAYSGDLLAKSVAATFAFAFVVARRREADPFHTWAACVTKVSPPP